METSSRGFVQTKRSRLQAIDFRTGTVSTFFKIYIRLKDCYNLSITGVF